MTGNTVTLGELGKWGSGGTPLRSKAEYYGQGFPWLKISDLNDGIVEESEEQITQEGLNNSSAKLVPKGAILVAMYGSIGKQGIAGIECTTNQAIAFCIPNDELVERDYLFWKIRSLRSDLLKLGRGGAQPNISQEILKRQEIWLPRIDEQRRIVSRIRESMTRVDELEQLRTESLMERAFLTESVIEAELADLEGDEVTMAEVCGITARLVDPRDQPYRSMLHVGGANIESKTGRLLNLKSAENENLKSGKFVFDASVVLYNKIRPYLMKVARPTFSGLCSADMYPLEPKPSRATRDFIYYVLMSRRFTDYAVSGSNRAGMPKVNREHLFAYRFTLPPLDVQQRICGQLDSAVESILQLGREMAEAEKESAQLREAILRKAFAGEL